VRGGTVGRDTALQARRPRVRFPMGSLKFFTNLTYILESNPHPFYSFRGLKNQMRIRIACGLDSQS